jgi:hypothetical protein
MSEYTVLNQFMADKMKNVNWWRGTGNPAGCVHKKLTSSMCELIGIPIKQHG